LQHCIEEASVANIAQPLYIQTRPQEKILDNKIMLVLITIPEAPNTSLCHIKHIQQAYPDSW